VGWVVAGVVVVWWVEVGWGWLEVGVEVPEAVVVVAAHAAVVLAGGAAV
jgi:hypothetical protein